jgi:hypothetical protein
MVIAECNRAFRHRIMPKRPRFQCDWIRMSYNNQVLHRPSIGLFVA